MKKQLFCLACLIGFTFGPSFWTEANAAGEFRRMKVKQKDVNESDIYQKQRLEAMDYLNKALTLHNLVRNVRSLAESENDYRDAVELSVVDYQRLNQHKQCNINLLNNAFVNAGAAWDRVTAQASLLDEKLSYELSQGEQDKLDLQAEAMDEDDYDKVLSDAKAAENSNKKGSTSLKDMHTGDEDQGDSVTWEIGRDVLVDLYANPTKYGALKTDFEFPMWEDEKYLYDIFVWEPHMKELKEYYIKGMLTEGITAGSKTGTLSFLDKKDLQESEVFKMVTDVILGTIQEQEKKLFPKRHSSLSHDKGEIEKAYQQYLMLLSAATKVNPPMTGKLAHAPLSPRKASNFGAFSSNLLTGYSGTMTKDSRYYMPLPPFDEIFYLQIENPDGYKEDYINKNRWGTGGDATVFHSELPTPWNYLRNYQGTWTTEYDTVCDYRTEEDPSSAVTDEEGNVTYSSITVPYNCRDDYSNPIHVFSSNLPLRSHVDIKKACDIFKSKAHTEQEGPDGQIVTSSDTSSPWEKWQSSVQNATLVGNRVLTPVHYEVANQEGEFYHKVGDKVESKYKEGIELTNRVSSYLDLKFSACTSYHMKEDRKAVFNRAREAFIKQAGEFGITIPADMSFLDTRLVNELIEKLQEHKDVFVNLAQDVLDTLPQEVIQQGVDLNKVVYELIADRKSRLFLSLQQKQEFLKELKQAVASEELMAETNKMKENEAEKRAKERLKGNCMSWSETSSPFLNLKTYWPDQGIYDNDLKQICGEEK